MKVDYQKIIEENFEILDYETQVPVPFKLNKVQQKYIKLLRAEHPEMEGIRDIVLKSRQEGFSSFILALFVVDFLVRPHSISICISHRKDSTDLLFKKVRFYIESYLKKLSIKTGSDYKTIAREFFKTDSKNLIENATNNATFYIGTAGSRVGGRGGSARNVLFSEAAFYMDTSLITAQEIIVGTAQQVPQDSGMIFIESTANGIGNYYHKTWEKASRGQSAYRPRFFGWQEFYSPEWIEKKRLEFPNDAMFKQEYPGNPREAFISSGTPYFNRPKLRDMLDLNMQPVIGGSIAPDGTIDPLEEDAPLRQYRELEMGEQVVVFADPADTHDFCAATVCSKKHLDFPIVFNQVMESSQFGYTLNNLCKYIFNSTGKWPKLAVERNTGQATIYVLKTLNYPDLFRMVDFTSQSNKERGSIGWVTTGHIAGGELRGTRRKMLDDFALALKQGIVKMYDKEQIEQFLEFVIIKGRGQTKSNMHDDLLMATVGSWQVQELTPTDDYDDYLSDEDIYEAREKWRFR